MKQLYFVRHGQTEWNAIARVQGQWNSDLNERGRAQADVNGRLLAGLDIEAVFASPLDRTRQTAEIINQYLELPINYDDRIKEWDCGDWSGEMYADVAIKWIDEWRALQADEFNYRGPNCENYPDMLARSTPFIEELRQRPEKNIAIISHGMISKAMMSRLLGLSEAETLGFHIDNDVVFRITLAHDAVELAHFVRGKGPLPGLAA